MPTGTYGTTLGQALGIWIQIYDKDLNLITTLLGGKSGEDFVGLEYSTKINGTGSAQFTVRIDNPKITTASMNHFNRVKISDHDGTVRWFGYINQKDVTLNTINIQCVGLLQLLNKRLTEDALVVQDEANSGIADLLHFTNVLEETGIKLGTYFERPTPDIQYSLNENTGAVANDAVGSNNGVVTGTWTTGRVGTAVNSNGAGQGIKIGTPIVDTSDYSLNIWINCPLATPGTWRAIVCRYGGSAAYHIMSHVDGRLGVHFSGSYYSLAGFNINTDVDTGWHMLTTVVSISDDTTKFYLDSEYLGSVAKAVTSAGGIGMIGNVNDTTGAFYSGDTDMFSFYGKKLSVDEIRFLYEQVDEVAFWKFNNSLVDYSWQNNEPTPTALSYIADGKFAESGSFDGATSYLSLADNQSWHFGTNSFAIEFWLKTTTASKYIFDSRNGTGYSTGSPGYNLYIDASGLLKGGLGDGVNYRSETATLSSTIPINDGNWNHVIVSYDRDHGLENVYINGALDGSTDISAITGSLDNVANLIIGAKWNISNFFAGELDNFKIIGNAITEAEAYERYNANYTAVDLTFNRSPILSAIKSISEAVDSQYEVDREGYLNFRKILGQDLSNSIIFRYDKTIIENANILGFNVQDNGTSVISKTFGTSNALTSEEEDATLRTSYGLLEQFKNFREQNDQDTLDGITATQNEGPRYSPTIELNPTLIEDNFDAGDIIKLELNNDFLLIDQTAQIVEKTVQIVGGQKKISVIVDNEEKTVLTDIKSLQEQVALINREI